MKTILKIVAVDKRVSKGGEAYAITHVILNDGLEGEFFGTDIQEGDRVRTFYDYKYDKVKVFKSKSHLTSP